MTDSYQNLKTFHFATDLQKRHNKKAIKCLILGNFGAMNHGDEAILAGEIEELQKIPHCTITVVSRHPEQVRKIHKVNAVNQYALNSVRREIRKSDFVIVGGGGLINKIERSYIGFLYQLYILFTYFLLPKLYRKKLYIMGIGIYDNANPLILRLVIPFFKSASFVTVRDLHSYTFLKSRNVLSTLYKDNSFLMDLLPKSDVLESEFFKKNFRPARMNIGISLVNPTSNKDEKRLLDTMVKLITQYKDTADFWYYATDFNPSYENDIAMGRRLRAEITSMYGKEVVFHTVPTHLTPQMTFSSFKLMNFIVAMRFHSAVFAYRNEIPFAGISYDKKCESFIHSIGKKALHVPTLSLDDITNSIL